LNLAGQFAERLILLDDGSVFADGSSEVVLDPALLEQVYGLRMERIEQNGTIYVFPISSSSAPHEEQRT